MSPLWLDRAGTAASATCAAHCVLLAVAPALVSAMGIGALATEAAEWGFFGLTVALALVAGWAGYRRHRAAWIVTGFGAGALLLLLGRLGEALEHELTSVLLGVAGAGLLVACHLASLARLHACDDGCQA